MPSLPDGDAKMEDGRWKIYACVDLGVWSIYDFYEFHESLRGLSSFDMQEAAWKVLDEYEDRPKSESPPEWAQIDVYGSQEPLRFLGSPEYHKALLGERTQQVHEGVAYVDDVLSESQREQLAE
eukprot:scaffold7374_cov211-Pinguiococcus_pyrenoidosus.AAC.1